MVEAKATRRSMAVLAGAAACERAGFTRVSMILSLISWLVERIDSPVPQRPIVETRHRQISRVVRITRGRRFVDVDAVARRLAGMHHAFVEAPCMREYVERFLWKTHVLLHPEIRHPQIEMQRRAHAYRRQIRRSMATGSYLV